MLVVNGPIRNEINMNYKIGAMGPYNHANATIGRSWGILSKCQTNIGHAGEAYMGSYGNPLNYNNVCFPENEERMPPGWNPISVQRNWQPADSVVTTFTGWAYGRPDCSMEQELLPQLPYWFKKFAPIESVTAIMDPDIAWRLYKESGVESKEEVIQYVEEHTFLPAKEFWTTSYHVDNFIRPPAQTGTDPYATWLTYADDEPVYYLKGKVNITVVGGETNQFWQIAAQRPASDASVDDWR